MRGWNGGRLESDQNRVYKDERSRDVQIQQSANPLFGIAFFAIVPPPGALPVVLIARGAVVTSARARSWRRALVLFGEKRRCELVEVDCCAGIQRGGKNE